MLSVRRFKGKGRGIVTDRRILKGELIERAPVILVPASETEHLDRTVLKDYWFYWDREGTAALVLGYGMIYSHSYKPNARLVRRERELAFDVVAIRSIEKDAEVTLNYNGDPDDDSPLWFKVLP